MRYSRINATSLIVIIASFVRLRADQAGPADDHDLHGLPSIVEDWRYAVPYEAAPLFKRMRSASSALTQQAVSTPRGPGPHGTRRHRSPHGRRTGTTSARPPATRGSPPAPAADGPGRGPPPRGRVRSR